MRDTKIEEMTLLNAVKERVERDKIKKGS